MQINSNATVNVLSCSLRELKRDALSGAFAFSHRFGADRLIGLRYRGKGSILMFHSVVGDIDRQLGQSIHVQDDVLRDMVRHLQTTGSDIVTLEEGMQRFTDPGSRHFVELTFDDGYRNNLTHALPVLEALGAPFTVYVNSYMLSGECDVWWLGLRDLLLAQDRVEIDPMGLKFLTTSEREKCQALLMITDWVHQDVENNAIALKRIMTRYGINIASIVRKEALDLEELKRLSRHELVTIGGHAETHLALNSLDEADAFGELVRNKQMLECAIQREVKHFAYPFGERNTARAREVKIAESAGFGTAVKTRTGNLFREHAVSPFLLPRLTVLNHDRNAQLLAKLAAVEKLLRQPFDPPIGILND
jgi:peptidoglycan/xylan/chitin deacetylase (PgdA/CDA1 family)